MKRKNKERRKERMTEEKKKRLTLSRRTEMIVCRKRWDNKLLPFISSPHFRGNLIPLLLRHIWNTSQYRLKPLQLIIVSLCWMCSSSSRLSTLNTFLQPTVKLLFDINTPALALAGFPTADDHRQLLVKSIDQNEICIFEHLWSNLIQPNSFLQVKVYWGCIFGPKVGNVIHRAGKVTV